MHGRSVDPSCLCVKRDPAAPLPPSLQALSACNFARGSRSASHISIRSCAGRARNGFVPLIAGEIHGDLEPQYVGSCGHRRVRQSFEGSIRYFLSDCCDVD
jgi:hypothetical protein